MFLLNSTSEVLELLTTTVADIDWTVTYQDFPNTDISYGVAEGKTNTALSTFMVSQPTDGNKRMIKMVTIRNIHASTSNVITVRKQIAANIYTWTPDVTLLAGEMYEYTEETGWTYYAADGTIKVDATTTGINSITGTVNRITVTGGINPVIDISASYIGQNSITTLGTITTGVLGTGAVIAGVTMTLGSDASYDIYYRAPGGVLTRLGNGVTGQVLSSTTGAAPSWITATTGTVTTISGVAANGFTWSISNPTTTPAITLTLQNASGSQAGQLIAADWTTFNNKENAITASTTAKYWRGDKTFQTLDTSIVTENTNLYFTQARVLATALAGLSIVGSSITAADSLLVMAGKLQNQINGLLGGAIYQGVYNATTNVPTLIDGTGTKGYYYVVNVGGNQNFGSGVINFNVGDWVIYNGTIWQKVDNTDAVTDVNGAIGSVSLVGTANRITVTGTTWDISSSYVGQSSITTLGTIVTGVWNGTAIANTFLANSSLTVNGTSISLGGSGTITANVTNALTVDNSSIQLNTGTTFDGSAARTISVKAGGITNAMLAGSIDLTTKVTGILPPANGGTGIANNTASTITISGNFATTFVTTFAGTYTLPTASATLLSNSLGITGGTTLIGGTAVANVLNLQVTSGNGTSTVAGINFLVGNNGGTTAGSIYNNGNWNIGVASTTGQRLFQIGQDTAFVSFGSLIGSTGLWAMYGNQTTPSATNYSYAGSSTTTIINATTDVRLNIGGTIFQQIQGAQAGGVVSNLKFTIPSNTNLTLSSAVPQVLCTLATSQFATGTISVTQPFVSITQPTIGFVLSSTAALTATFRIAGAPNSGTNAIQTVTVGILVESSAVNGTGTAGTSYGLYSNAQTGATSNYAAGFSGGLGVFMNDIPFVFGTTIGTKLASANNQKVGVWGTTPIVQPTTAFASSTIVAGGGSGINTLDTFDGYTVAQVIKALRTIGWLA